MKQETNRRKFLALSLVLTGAGALALAGCGGGKSTFTNGGGAALPQGKAAVRAIALSAHQSISGGRFYAFAAIKLAAPAGSQFTTRAAQGSRAVPDAIVYDAGLQLYKKYASTGSTVSVRYYTDAAATVPAGTATITELGGGDFTNSYPNYPATVNFAADTTEGTVPFTGSGSITYLDASGANTLTGSFTSKRNNVTLAGTLNLTGAGDVTGGMTMTQGGVTTRVTGITGTLSGDLTGSVVSDPYGWTGTIRFSIATGAFTLTLDLGTGTGGGTVSASLDTSGNLVIQFADGTTQTIASPLNEFIDGSGGGSTPTPTPSPTPSSNPGNATYTAVLLPSTGFKYTDIAGAFGDTQVGAGIVNGVDNGAFHALLWKGTAAGVVDLNPTGFFDSQALGASDNSQVGIGFTAASGGFKFHALLWNGTAASAVDLHPAGFTTSQANGVSGTIQVGEGDMTGNNTSFHALLWSGTAASVVDLNPTGFSGSKATGASGNFQVGYGFTGSSSHALLWKGTAASAVDLNPSGFTSSLALGISGDTQVGYGFPPGVSYSHALLWRGSASTVTDLHPQGFTNSQANAVLGSTQAGVGFPTNGSDNHALVWQGAAASAVDLHAATLSLTQNGVRLSPVSSQATGINSNGDISGFVTDKDTTNYAVLWVKN